MNVLWVSQGKVESQAGQPYSDELNVRLRVLAPANFLFDEGIHSDFVCPNENWTKNDFEGLTSYDLIVFASPSMAVEREMALAAKETNVAIVVDLVSDPNGSSEANSIAQQMLSIANTVTVPSLFYKNLLNDSLEVGADIVADPVEQYRRRAVFNPNEKLNLLCLCDVVDRHFDKLFAELVILAEDINVKLIVMAKNVEEVKKTTVRYEVNLNQPFQFDIQEWNEVEIPHNIINSDVVMLPCSENSSNAFGRSRLLCESLWMGKFVVASESEVRKEFQQFAWISEDLTSGVKWAIENQNDVLGVIRAGQKYVESNNDWQSITQQWKRVFQSALAKKLLFNINKSGNPVRLNLGCGDKLLDGYINVDVVDARLEKKPDIQSDLQDLSFIASNSVDEILSVHVVEHFWRWEVEAVLSEWKRILKPNGKMILECPNLQSACETFLENPDLRAGEGGEGQRTMWVFYGDPAWKDELMVHRWGYTPNSLGKMLEKIGFRQIRQEAAEFKLREPRDMRIVGIK